MQRWAEVCEPAHCGMQTGRHERRPRVAQGLGMAGVQLLKEGVDGLVADIERLIPTFTTRSIGNE